MEKFEMNSKCNRWNTLTEKWNKYLITRSRKQVERIGREIILFNEKGVKSKNYMGVGCNIVAMREGGLYIYLQAKLTRASNSVRGPTGLLAPWQIELMIRERRVSWGCPTLMRVPNRRNTSECLDHVRGINLQNVKYLIFLVGKIVTPK